MSKQHSDPHRRESLDALGRDYCIDFGRPFNANCVVCHEDYNVDVARQLGSPIPGRICCAMCADIQSRFRV